MRETMRILAIDPGYDRLGIAIIEGNPSRPTLLWSDCVIPPKGHTEQRLARISEAVTKATKDYSPDALAIETLFFSVNKKTAFGVAEARGAILAVAGIASIPVIECSPQQVKIAVTGYGGAQKSAIANMIPQLLTLTEKKRLDDELDAIAPKREDVSGEVERRVVSQLLTMMDGLKSRGKVVVIGATNRPNSIDSALRRPGRFDREIEINVPSKDGRLSILKIHTRGMPLTKDVKLEDLAAITHGFVGADLESLAKEAAMVVLRGLLPQMKLDEEEKIPQHLLDKLKIHHSDFTEALKVVRPSAMREVLVETPNINWNDVVGLEEIKRELREAVEWPIKYPDNFKRMGIRPSKGILLYGPPGTGKTLLAKAVAKESEANFIQVKGPSLLSMWVGKSEEGMRKIFERARQVAPCIVFFDEIDSLAGKRGMEQGTKVTERVLNQMLAEMDGIEDVNDILVIGATNRPDMLDPAILRPGRFDKILLVNAPDEIGRETILKIHTKNMPITLTKEEIKELDDTFKNEKINFTYSKMASDKSLNEEDLNKLKNKNKIDFKSLSDKDKLLYYLAKKAEGYTGADLEALAREAALLSLRENINAEEVHKKHFEEALNKVKPSVTTNTIKVYKKVEEQFLKSAKSATPIQEGCFFKQKTAYDITV